jgi:hypothetical protein
MFPGFLYEFDPGGTFPSGIASVVRDAVLLICRLIISNNTNEVFSTDPSSIKIKNLQKQNHHHNEVKGERLISCYKK